VKILKSQLSCSGALLVQLTYLDRLTFSGLAVIVLNLSLFSYTSRFMLVAYYSILILHEIIFVICRYFPLETQCAQHRTGDFWTNAERGYGRGGGGGEFWGGGGGVLWGGWGGVRGRGFFNFFS